jgi:hypothetical protein
VTICPDSKARAARKFLNLPRLKPMEQLHNRSGESYEHISAKQKHVELREETFRMDDEARESACV